MQCHAHHLCLRFCTGTGKSLARNRILDSLVVVHTCSSLPYGLGSSTIDGKGKLFEPVCGTFPMSSPSAPLLPTLPFFFFFYTLCMYLVIFNRPLCCNCLKRSSVFGRETTVVSQRFHNPVNLDAAPSQWSFIIFPC